MKHNLTYLRVQSVFYSYVYDNMTILTAQRFKCARKDLSFKSQYHIVYRKSLKNVAGTMQTRCADLIIRFHYNSWVHVG